MKRYHLFAATALSLFVGCSQPASETSSEDPIVIDDMPPMMDDHDHPDHGPHGGELVEIGQGDLHIELARDETQAIFYVLDGAVVDPVAIESDTLTVSLKHDGNVQSFEIASEPQASDHTGRTSRFMSRDNTLLAWLQAEAKGAVTLRTGGKSLTGKISQDHDHEH